MLWEEYYDKLREWKTSTAVNRMSRLESFGPPDEIVNAINTIGFDDNAGASRLLTKAIATGVKFTGAQLADICPVCDDAVRNRAIRFSSDRFTTEDLDALYCSCDDAILIEIAKKHRIRLPEDLAECEEMSGSESTFRTDSNPARYNPIHCPDCGERAGSNFCPNCGKDLRIRHVPAVVPRQSTGDYDAYLRFYPNKAEAIRALRNDTEICLTEAKEIIDRLFGADIMPREPKFHHDKEWKAVAPAKEHRPVQTVEADVSYYANKFYPDKARAIRALMDLGIGAADARRAMDDAFLEIQNSRASLKANDRLEKAQAAAGGIVKIICLVISFFLFGFFRMIAGLVKPYMGKRR